MPSEDAGARTANGQVPTERSPLLGSRNQAAQDGDAADATDNDEVMPDGTPKPETPTQPKLFLIMGSMYLASFVAAMDQTIIATLSGPISASFNSFTLLAWVASAYIIATAAVQPISGKMTDIYGRRAGLIFAFTFFAIGNLICGLAGKPWVIILGRVVAGAGGGCINTTSTFITSDLIPLRRRGVWQGIANVSWGLGSAFGGFFGGWMNDSIGWRWAFLIQIPPILIFGSVAIYMVNIPIKETNKSKLKRVDFLGAFLLMSSLVTLLLALNSGGNVVPWNHPLVYVCIPVAVILFLLFVYVEERIAPEPVIPVRLMLNRTISGAGLANLFLSMAMYQIFTFIPIFFQARGYSATRAGTPLIPCAIGTSVGSLGSGILMRSTGKYWWLNVAAQSMYILGITLVLAFFNATVPLWQPYIFLSFIGTGYGALLTITLIALISAVDHKFQAIVTSMSYAFRSVGGTLGITIAGAVFQNILKDRLYARFGREPGAIEQIGRIRNSLDELKRLPPGWEVGVSDSYIEAFRGVWAVTLGIAVTGAVASLLMKEHTLFNNLERTK